MGNSRGKRIKYIVHSNVTEAGLRSYIAVFHRILGDTVKQFLPQEQQAALHHLSLLPAKITCYVSTQFGVAFEYDPANSTEISSVHGSARIEDLAVRAPKRWRETGAVFDLTRSNIRVRQVEINDPKFPFLLQDYESWLSVEKLSLKDDHWARYINYAEIYGDRTSEQWSHIQAVQRAKDEVLVAIVESNRAAQHSLTLSEYLQQYKAKTVLLLGSCTTAGRD